MSSSESDAPTQFIPLIDLYRLLCEVCYNHGWNSPLLEFFDTNFKDLNKIELNNWIIPEKYWSITVEEFYDFIKKTASTNQALFPLRSKNLSTVRRRFPDSFEFPTDGVFFKEVYPTLKNDFMLNELIKNESSTKSFTQIVSLSSNEHEAVNIYTHKYDGPINANLRNGKVHAGIDNIINDIIGAIKKQHFLPPFIAYRGISPWRTFSIGDQFCDPGFMSKSWSLDEAANFSDGSCCILICWYPVKTQQLFVEELSTYSEEHEIISFPAEIWEVVDEGNIDVIITEDNERTLVNKKAYLLKYLKRKEIDIVRDLDFDQKIENAYDNFVKYLKISRSDIPLIDFFNSSIVVITNENHDMRRWIYMTNGPLDELVKTTLGSVVMLKVEYLADLRVQCLRGDFNSIYIIHFGDTLMQALLTISENNHIIYTEHSDDGIISTSMVRTDKDCYHLIASIIYQDVITVNMNAEDVLPFVTYIYE